MLIDVREKERREERERMDIEVQLTLRLGEKMPMFYLEPILRLEGWSTCRFWILKSMINDKVKSLPCIFSIKKAICLIIFWLLNSSSLNPFDLFFFFIYVYNWCCFRDFYTTGRFDHTKCFFSVLYFTKNDKKKKMTDLEVCVNVICDLIISLFVLKLSQILHVI